MGVGTAISIKDLCERYGIKGSAAYKWRTALRNIGLEESWENYDRVSNREINLSEAARGESAIAVATPSKVRQPKPPAIAVSEPVTAPMMDSGFGLSIGRLRELNSEAELEVLVKSKLKDYHESNLQSQRSQELKSRIEEVQGIDPKQLGKMLASLGV